MCHSRAKVKMSKCITVDQEIWVIPTLDQPPASRPGQAAVRPHLAGPEALSGGKRAEDAGVLRMRPVR